MPSKSRQAVTTKTWAITRRMKKVIAAKLGVSMTELDYKLVTDYARRNGIDVSDLAGIFDDLEGDGD